MSDDSAALAATAKEWLASGHKLAIATVLKTWGSAPRRAGSHLLIRDDGMFKGSVSGGCVEGDVIVEALSVLETRSPKRLHYGVAEAAAWEVGLACGGEIDILVQPVSAEGFAPTFLDRIASAAKSGKRLKLHTGRDGVTYETAPKDELAFTREYLPPLELILVGAVHISQALVSIAGELGYRVRLVDPRGAFANAERFACIDVDARWPDEALSAWKPGPATAIVALTHDPKLDDPALAGALSSEAFYIAALGSRKTHAARRKRLAARGFTAQDLDRIHGPAGLSIGAANPAEIALAIAAQMIAVWHGRT